MGKLLFITPCPVPENIENQSDGVVRKIYQQYQAFQQLFDTYLLGYVEKKIALYHNGEIKILSSVKIKQLRRFRLYEVANHLIGENRVPYCYARHDRSNKKIHRYAEKYKRDGRANYFGNSHISL